MKKRFPLSLLTLIVLLGAEVVLSLGAPLAYLLSTEVSEVLGFVLLRIFESARLLLLLMMLGAAFGAVSAGGVKISLFLLAGAAVTHLAGEILILVWQALFFRIAISELNLALTLAAAFDDALLPLVVSFLFSYFIFLKKDPKGEPRGMGDTHAAPVKAAILASSLLFTYRFARQVIYAVQFADEAFGFIFLKPGEQAALILDFVPVLAVSAGGYFLMLLARGLYVRLSAAWEARAALLTASEAEKKSAKEKTPE